MSNTELIGTLNALGNSFNNLTLHGIHNQSSSGITTLNVSNSSFTNLSSSGIFNVGPLGTLNATANTFNNVASGIVNDIGQTVNTISVSQSGFTNISGFGVQNHRGIIENTFSVSHCSFDNVNPAGVGIFYDAATAPFDVSLEIIDNVFAPVTSPGTGYAVTVNMTQPAPSLLCLDFIGNSAPVTSPAAYQFTNTTETFNLTLGSDNSANTGEFSLSGSIGAPGSCSAP